MSFRLIAKDYAIMGTDVYNIQYTVPRIIYYVRMHMKKRPTNDENKYTIIECTNMECRYSGLSTFWSVNILVCRRFGLSTFWFVEVSVCRRFGTVDVLVCRGFGLSTFWLSTFWFVDVLTSYHT